MIACAAARKRELSLTDLELIPEFIVLILLSWPNELPVGTGSISQSALCHLTSWRNRQKAQEAVVVLSTFKHPFYYITTPSVVKATLDPRPTIDILTLPLDTKPVDIFGCSCSSSGARAQANKHKRAHAQTCREVVRASLVSRCGIKRMASVHR